MAINGPLVVVTQFLRLNKTLLLAVGRLFRPQMSWRDKVAEVRRHVRTSPRVPESAGSPGESKCDRAEAEVIELLAYGGASVPS
jgi:hypothetical protein